MLDKKLNFIFWGTPEVASKTLEILKDSGYLPSLIITGPDKPQGRKMVTTPPPVKTWAIKNNIPYIQPENLKENVLNNFTADLSIVVAYGKIIPEYMINYPKFGSINIHYSLLPKYRGASPVESAILNGDKETGVSIQKMEFKMDSGPIIASEKTSIGDNEKAFDLRERLIKIGGELLVKTLPSYLDGKLRLIPQNETEATFSKKIKKEDGLTDLNDDPIVNFNKWRAYIKWPRSYFFKNNKRIIITDAELSLNKFVIKKVLPEGKKEIRYEEFLRNNPD